ncbi:transglycosylase SLT domain-containing protein [Maridesulfovibrio sp.]|uniref:transglycosylase SLT domain-containing protein n=1 Tax=Maridesulfovibrio sp. TaxID=2795000 RepID=UPI002A189E95|nr:transglycosylase SLT domain-containing protein [Maridesulfovibrio sp.]
MYLSFFIFLTQLYLVRHEIPLPKKLRVAAVNTERVFPRLSPWGPGFDRELLNEFGKFCNASMTVTPYPTHAEAFEALTSGKADIMLASGYNPGTLPTSIPLARGPVYEKEQPEMLHNIGRFELRTPYELCGLEVFVPGNADLIQTFENLKEHLDCTPVLMSTDSAAHLKPLLQLNNDKSVRFQLVEAGAFKPIKPFLHRLRVTENFGEELEYRWYLRNDIHGLKQAVDDYWNHVRTNGTLADKREMYFGFIPEETDFYDLYTLRKDVREKLPLYSKYITKAAKRYEIDPFLLAAVMYQESRFDPLAQSRTGVRGLMQLTRDTADLLGLTSRLDPQQSINGGARYLKFLWEKMEYRNVTGWNRWLFTLAAYNQGLGHVYDAMDIASYINKHPGTWRSLKQVFPLLTRRKYHSKTRHGYTRGYEAVDYVDSVRYYYYILKGLSVLPGEERNYLAPLVSG